jgi:hypothetical protein
MLGILLLSLMLSIQEVISARLGRSYIESLDLQNTVEFAFVDAALETVAVDVVVFVDAKPFEIVEREIGVAVVEEFDAEVVAGDEEVVEVTQRGLGHQPFAIDSLGPSAIENKMKSACVEFHRLPCDEEYLFLGT